MPIGLFFNVLTLIWFTLNDSFESLLLSRALTGLFQEFMCIYFPIWADCFASEEKKSTWMSILIIGATLGNIIGYIIAASL